MTAVITEFPDGGESDIVLSIGLVHPDNPSATARVLADHYPAMINRISNRNFGRRSRIGEHIGQELRAAAESEGATFRLLTDRGRIGPDGATFWPNRIGCGISPRCCTGK